eukprot:GHUV01010437.1.p1 GENE.GHUV01010437.1~~GHUV01010437.1.p1  ORF type:complete len:412 (+),score=116.71 GHUV01010437.1:926-2161(+)
MDEQVDDSTSTATRRSNGFVGNLQPLLVVGPGNAAASTFQTSAWSAATRHISVTRKLVTDRRRSNLLIQPVTSLEPVRPRSHTHVSPPPLQLRNRCSAAPAGLKRVIISATTAPALPRVLQFETWWVAGGKKHQMLVDYHTANGEFCVKGAGSEAVWLTMHVSSGQQLNHWDLHVGAELDMLGRKIVLKKASCATTLWLDSWAKLLLHHKRHLEAELAKFAPVVQCRTSGLWNHQGMKPDKLDFEYGPHECEPVDGKLHLRHLRDDVAHLAWRLRQYKPVVQLPPGLEDLKPHQGPGMWSISGACLSPRVLSTPEASEPSMTAVGTHTSGSSTHRELIVVHPDSADSQQLCLPSLGQTPTTLNQPSALNRADPLACLQGNSLALSAAMSRKYNSYTAPQTRPSSLGTKVSV